MIPTSCKDLGEEFGKGLRPDRTAPAAGLRPWCAAFGRHAGCRRVRLGEKALPAAFFENRCFRFWPFADFRRSMVRLLCGGLSLCARGRGAYTLPCFLIFRFRGGICSGPNKIRFQGPASARHRARMAKKAAARHLFQTVRADGAAPCRISPRSFHIGCFVI